MAAIRYIIVDNLDFFLKVQNDALLIKHHAIKKGPKLVDLGPYSALTVTNR